MVDVAQLVEPRIVIPVVVGSNPIIHPIPPKFLSLLLSNFKCFSNILMKKITQQINSYTISDILSRVRSGVYVIPQFQRDFVWRPNQILGLIDSIARDYPVGSLLTLIENPEIRFDSKSIHAMIKEEESDSENSRKQIEYILDGQQRITSIARVFLNAIPKNPKKEKESYAFYFDLKSMYKDFKSGDWIVLRSNTNKTDAVRLENNQLIRADIILDSTQTNKFVREYFRKSTDPKLDFPENEDMKEDAITDATSRINDIFHTIRDYRIHVLVLGADSPLESVCRIFETINSTGTKLNTFDLAIAKFFPDPDLRKLWDKSKEDFTILKDFNVEGERVLQVLALLEAKINPPETGGFPEVTRSRLLNTKSDFIKTHWNVAVKALVDVYQWVTDRGAAPKRLSNKAILVAMAASNIVNNAVIRRTFSNADAVLQKWYLTKIMPPVNFIATNYRISEDFNTLCGYFEKNEPLDFKKVELSKSDLIKDIHSPTENRYKAIQCIIAITAKKDFISGETLGITELEDHHIFPLSLSKGQSKEYKNLLNSIINRIVISKKTNRELTNRHPADYFRELRKTVLADKTIVEAKRRLKDCCLPDNIESPDFSKQFEDSNFESFLEHRANLILERVRDILGEHLSEEITTTHRYSEDEPDYLDE